MESAFAKCHEELSTHCIQAQNQLIEILTSNWKSSLSKSDRKKGEPSTAIIEIIKSTTKVHSIIKAEANTQLLENMFRESLRTLSEIIDGLIAQAKEKELIRVDMQALLKCIESLGFKDDIDGVVIQKITSVLLAKCGIDL